MTTIACSASIAILVVAWSEEAPSAPRVIATVLILLITLARLKLFTSRTDQLLNKSMLLSSIAVVLCDPGWKSLLTAHAVWLQQCSLDVWHSLFIISAGYLLLYCVNARERRSLSPRPRQIVVILGVTSISAIFCISQLRPERQLLHTSGAWPFAAYFWSYAITMALFCLPAVAIFFGDAVRGGSPRQVVFAALAAIFAIAGVASIIGIAVGATRIITGSADAGVLKSVESRVYGEYMAVFLAPLFATVTPSLVRLVQHRLELDKHSKAMTTLRPMWEDMLTEVPEVRFRLQRPDISGDSREEAARRMISEVSDAAVVLLGRAAAQERLLERGSSAADEANALMAAINSSKPAAARRYESLKFDVLTIAEHWK